MVTTSAFPLRLISPEVAAPPQTDAPRFTIDGSAALEAHLASCCDLVKTAIAGAFPGQLDGLLLGGGYGRGEGGVLQSANGEEPYNDLEFYIFVRGNPHLFEQRFHSRIHELHKQLTEAIGIEVEFKVMSLAQLRRAPISMFFYDMLAGHKWLIGSDDLLRGCEHHGAAHLLTLSEGARLLMNRCSGLLFAREQLSAHPFTPAGADFIRRNISKAQLAFGDAVLTAFGRYHWSARERHRRLQNFTVPLPWQADLIEHHRAGLAFKLRPWRSEETREQLEIDLTEAVAFARELWLWLEGKRLRHAFISTRHYALSGLWKWPEAKRWRNLLTNLKAFRRPVLPAFRHPRERVLESLALLLWEPAALIDSTLRHRLSRNLRTPVRTFPEAVAAYRCLWTLVN